MNTSSDRPRHSCRATGSWAVLQRLLLKRSQRTGDLLLGALAALFLFGAPPALSASSGSSNAGSVASDLYAPAESSIIAARVGSASEVAQDESVPALLAVAGRDEAGKDPARGWFALGTGVEGQGGGAGVRAFAVFDDGTGPALYAGGTFTAAGGVATTHVAKWDGAEWLPLGSGLGGGWAVAVNALAVFDDGTGPALYAGGSFRFTTDDGERIERIAKWDGATWSALGSGLSERVNALAVFDDGTGPALYAGGSFVTAGGERVNRIAKWDGSNWSALGEGVDGRVNALAVMGDNLYAGGHFRYIGRERVHKIARWDGSRWWPLGVMRLQGLGNHYVSALEVFDDGTGPALYIGGSYIAAGDLLVNNIARWNGSSWSALDHACRERRVRRSYPSVGCGTKNVVRALAVFDVGSGPALYVGGAFDWAGDETGVNGIAKWDGSSWSGLGAGGVDREVNALIGMGDDLFIGGSFFAVGGIGAANIARWSPAE